MNFFAANDIDQSRSVHWLLPEQAELIYGTISSIIVFAVLIKFGGPLIGKALKGRTDKIQAELDESAQAKAAAEAEAVEIRKAAGDIDAERQRRFAEADAEAEVLLAQGRERLEVEVAELRAAAAADVESASGRVNDELRHEISRLASQATERALVGGVVDDATQQELIEAFISRVGQGAPS